MRGVPAALSSAGGISLSVSGLTKRCSKTLSFSRHHIPSPTCFSTNSSPGDSSASKPWLLVGLGNPGKSYQGTRHNVGFEMINAIAEAEGISVTNIHCKALLGKGCIGDVPVMLAKPQTFMNLSGESVGSLVSYFKIPLNQVLLMYDDLDLPFAKLRLLPKGGHGGQNGHWKATRKDGPCCFCSKTLHQERKRRDGLHSSKRSRSCEDFIAPWF
ncbi:peptidyl-tRNA hydrolase, mitochondrial isoform X3 [Dendrobium catenatum]|uniref:peptidyl-tRNA hydrolase, mitochondrial isoform X3 n=1 Tax=Dendrobium catenatum TaxID=906689 RepID=UPI0009F3E678|nr:peptidyl-tRNA hydrolase, mitochondrial isoform X3 [Dendrobium catenatum]